MKKWFLLFWICAVFLSGCGDRAGKLVFPDLNPHEITYVKLENEKKTHHLEFHKTGHSTWDVSDKGVLYLGDSKAILDFITKITNITYSKAKDDEQKLKTAAECKGGTLVVLKRAGKMYKLYVKKAGPDYKSSYIMVGDEDDCFRCCPYLNSLVNHTLQKWIKKDVFTDDVQNVLSVQIASQNKDILHWKRSDADSPWQDFLNPSNTLNKKDVDSLYAFLSKLKVYDGVPKDENVDYGFNPPLLHIRVLACNSMVSFLMIGNKKNSSFFFAQRSDKEQGVVLFSSLWLKKCEDKLNEILSQSIQLK